MRKLLGLFVTFIVFGFLASGVSAQVKTPVISPTPIVSPSPEPTEIFTPKPDITQKSEETLGPLEKLLEEQKLGSLHISNFVKHAIRSAVSVGVPANTIVLLLLLPVVATVIAITRQIIGVRGFGIFLPAALSVTLVAIGPVLGITLFMVIVIISTLVRLITRKLKIRLQYLPRMALILWFVAVGLLGVLFATPYINYPSLKNVSIFPVLVLTLLVEDFIRIQTGKSIATAIRLTFQTLILAMIAYAFLTLEAFQGYVLLNPEISLLITFIADIILGKYIGLRVLEYWRFRKLINNK